MMQLFDQVITEIKPRNFNPEASKQIWQLNLSKNLDTILQAIEVNNDTPVVYSIYGEPGSGCSTLMQGLCQQICKRNIATQSEMLYLALSAGCNQDILGQFILEQFKKQDDKRDKSLSSQFSDDAERKSSLAKILEQHFKVICIDNSGVSGDFIDCFLFDMLSTCKVASFVVRSHEKHSRELLSNINVNGLTDSAARNLASQEIKPLNLTEDETARLCALANYNPVAIQLLCALMNQENNYISSLVKGDGSSVENCRALQTASCALEMALEWICKVVKVSSFGALCGLCSLRRPLPMAKEHPFYEELACMKLLCVSKPEGNAQCIHIHPSVKKYLQKRKMTNHSNEETDIDVLALWLSLVLIELLSLISEAEDQTWAFVPEKWQYIKDVSEKENYNVKELLTANNSIAPPMTEYEILQECSYHAYLQGDFKKLAAITFVLDRFLFWSGDTKTTMEVVDYIQAKSPETAISPQLIIRRARFMKNEGNLRGADSTLDTLLQSKTKIGQWKYKEEQDYQVVCGVCVQIKGEIQYHLGHWQQAAFLLIRSIQLFGSLPKPDKKGLSSSYGLLSLCLRNMTVYDYLPLVRYGGLAQCNPLLAAYFSSQEACKLSVFTPMFFLRHSCQAGEVMIEFAKLAPTHQNQQLLLRIAIEDLRDSIQSHQTYKSLTSREQFYVLVCACYKVSLALIQIQLHSDQCQGNKLKKLSLELYEHYCSTPGHVLIDDHIIQLIDDALTLLGLEKFQTTDVPNAGKMLLDYHTRRSAERVASGTCLAGLQLITNSQAMFTAGPSQFSCSLPKQDSNFHQGRVTIASPNGISGNEVVDQNAPTIELPEEDISSRTKEFLSLEDPQNGTNDDNEDVAQGATTEETTQQSDKESLKDFIESASVPWPVGKSQGRNGIQQKAEDSPQVDRHAATEELQGEKKESIQKNAVESHIGFLASIKKTQKGKKMVADGNTLGRSPLKTVDELALSLGQTVQNSLHSEIVVQTLEEEAKQLPSLQTPVAGYADGSLAGEEKIKQARDAMVWKYDFPSKQWRGQPTIVFIGEPLKLDKKKLGGQRDVYTVEFINQEDPLGKYVAKTYRKKRKEEQYKSDVLSQMTARHYVALFNQCLAQATEGDSIGEIQFLPVVLLHLINASGHVTEIFNAEPYMSGEFDKLTNNVAWRNKDRETDLVLAYSHFTYQASQGNLIVVDIQGWVPHDKKGCTFLTDPQIHSPVYKCFGSSNWKQEGIENFWKNMHVECNKICKMLNLVRPSY